MNAACLATLALLVWPHTLPAQSASAAMIDGIVTDTSLVPIASVEISILRTAVRLATGDNGRFHITAVPPGQYLMTVRKVGYRPVVRVVELLPADTLRLSVFLERAYTTLDTVRVTDRGRSLRMAEFDRRRDQEHGQFLGEEEIAKRNTPFATELIRTFSSVTVKTYPGGGGAMQYFAISSRSGTQDVYKLPIRRGAQEETIKGCPMEVYIDGVRMPTPFSLDLLPPPSSLAGIELYTGPATTPPQFGGPDRRCGVIAVWTKDGS